MYWPAAAIDPDAAVDSASPVTITEPLSTEFIVIVSRSDEFKVVDKADKNLL